MNTPKTDTPETEAHYNGIVDKGSRAAGRAPDLMRKLERERDEARRELAELKSKAMPFIAIYAAEYGEEYIGEKSMYAYHYDLLEYTGARMDAFHRGPKTSADLTTKQPE